jgi:2-haloacid dehalogenase
LKRLKAAGIRIVALSDFSPAMMQANAENAGIMELFDELVSTDAGHTFKPDPRAYQLAIDRLHIQKEDVVFAAFGSWDAYGAKQFGFPTVWINRFGLPRENLGLVPDKTSTGIDGLIDFVLGQQDD